jgi:hypothetical protein
LTQSIIQAAPYVCKETRSAKAVKCFYPNLGVLKVVKGRKDPIMKRLMNNLIKLKKTSKNTMRA